MSFSELDTKIPATVDDPKALREFDLARSSPRGAQSAARLPRSFLAAQVFRPARARARFAWD